MSVALIEPVVEMTATLNVVVSINSTTVMLPYWTAPFSLRKNHLFYEFFFQEVKVKFRVKNVSAKKCIYALFSFCLN